MTSVLIWGFYQQGNLGDDLMGMLLYEMLEELGAKPTIWSSNPRFGEMGYRSVEGFADINPDLLVLGGGAFFKSAADSKKPIEDRLAQLGDFVREKRVPVHGVSLGSDGVATLAELSPARQAIVKHESFKSVALRLASDQRLGLTNTKHIDDLVLLTALCSERYKRLKPIEPKGETPRTLINLSRRSALHLPGILWRERNAKIVFFRAHTSQGYEKAEVTIPGYQTVSDGRLQAQLGYLSSADRIVSSKLHPGVIALSYGREFEPVRPRPKTAKFLSEMRKRPADPKILFKSYMAHLQALLS